ncbi:MAG: DUF192 domain-containing protein [Phycisphaerae bacterium]|nr:DUF192 domain-containing protein [Phycisphaerae bacterium]
MVAKTILIVSIAAVAMLGLGMGCLSTSESNSAQREFPLDTLETATIQVGDNQLTVWLAKTDAQRSEGLMHLSADEIPDDQGMLFIFDQEQYLSFWMRNTYISLDIAFARSDGEIVTIHQMPPLTLQSYPSVEPARFALEMKAGAFERLGISEGMRLVIPDDVLK